ncbi:MAG TPA: hypothetical protein PL045_13440 [Chitinophagaceae bacterium]|nr:hypothetical protein [Chitinophagaceae bacterium]
MNTHRNITNKALVFFSAVLLLFSCTFSTFTTEPVEYTGDATALSDSLTDLLHCENVYAQSVKETTNGQPASFININIINAKNLPADMETKSKLGKDIAHDIREIVKDPSAYQFYKVFFIESKTSGAFTESTSQFFVYSNEDLETFSKPL